MASGSSPTERRPARDGRPALGAQAALLVVALVALAAAVQHVAIAADRHGWTQHDGIVSSVEPRYDLFALFAKALGGGTAPTDYTVAVMADDELFFDTMRHLSKGVYIIDDIGYTGSMTKRLVEIDDDLLERARAAAGAETIKATVETALQRLVDRETAVRHVSRLRKKGALDVARLEEARRPRAGPDG